MEKSQASRTAVLVCQGRAVAHGRLAAGRFDDPTALALLRVEERAPVENARAGVAPRSVSARMDFEMFGRQAEAMAVRTVAIDDAVRSGGNSQLVIVGAGLDGRAWRMPELSSVEVFEVDHPASQEDKRARVSALGPAIGSVRFVPIDLAREDLGDALVAAGHDEARPTTWVLEGVIPYLTSDETAHTVAALAARSAPGSRLVVSYQTSSTTASLGRALARRALALSGRGDPMANEPRRSSWSPESVRAVLAEAGLWVSGDVALQDLARDLDVPTRHLGTSRVAVAVVPAA